MSRLLTLSLFFLLAAFPTLAQSDANRYKQWMIGPFQKLDSKNPVLEPRRTTSFICPIQKSAVRWEEKDVYNPATVVRNGQVYMLYRAEDTVKAVGGTSRLGLAVSPDGINFKRLEKPVFYPDNDAMKVYEWMGGCEDPRVVEIPEGTYLMTYTAYDGDKARLCVATSRDLLSWQKKGLAFAKAYDGKYGKGWSKSGSIVCRRVGSRLVAQKINGLYWMYWGDQQELYVATSSDLINWTPLQKEDGTLLGVATYRPGKHDYRVLEPGPPALLTPKGIVLIYNGMNDAKRGDSALPEGAYAAGQMLFNPKNPTQLVDRSDSYFMKPDQPYETAGQVNQVCFLEGLVPFRGKWFLYYGTADSRIAVATAPLLP